MAIGNIPNSHNTPPIIPHVPPPAVGGTGPVSGTGKAGDTQGVRPPGGLSIPVGAGEVSYSSPNLEGIDWGALTSDYNNVENLSISITAIMVLMIDVMKELRKGQREAWMDEAQNALQMGMNAAERMRESAAAKIASDVISNAASMATAAISVATSVGGLRSSHAADIRIEADATKLFGPAVDIKAPQLETPKVTLQTPASQAPTVELSVETPTVGGASGTTTPTLSSAGATGDTPTSSALSTPAGADTPVPDAPAANTTAQTTPQAAPQGAEKPAAASATPAAGAEDGTADASPTTSSSGTQASDVPAEGDTASPADKASAATKQATSQAENQKARAQYVSQQRSLAQSSFDQKANIVKGLSEVGAAVAKMGAAVGEYYAGRMQAEAKEFEALGSYSQALMQAELEFANQMRDAIRTVIDTMKGAEQAKHQAMQGIYNI
jgi:hypothetical protein